MKRQEENQREVWDNMKQSNIQIIGVLEQQEEELFEEIMSENFPDVAKKKATQAQRFTNRMNLKRPTPRHIIIMMINIQDKETILKAQDRDRNLHTNLTPLDYQIISQQKHIRPEKNGRKSTK
uniref:L1 transposable element RRM domain-containing protein n=1 Tax=Pipistrellus kuhlii TaxID=59472 RepID=A0A7J7SFY3_PIPKU|nr:hypothetical protein mPipKuh1_009952 [Pipistrellus kuhlii]